MEERKKDSKKNNATRELVRHIDTNQELSEGFLHVRNEEDEKEEIKNDSNEENTEN